MRILVTGGSGRLARAIAAEMGDEHQLYLMDTRPAEVAGCHQFVQGSILEPDDAREAVEGMDALIHTGDPPPDLPPGELAREQMLLDLATRGTYTILDAATSAGLKKLIYAGTLAIFGLYPEDLRISEYWKPLPSPDTAQIGRYLAELVCREFARDHPVTATCLRLGKLVLEEEVEGEEPDPMWLDPRDAAHAFACALRRDNSGSIHSWERWAVYHICADAPNPRFLIRKARDDLGFTPTHGFHAQQREPEGRRIA